MLAFAPAPQTFLWSSTTGGSWSNSGNWTGGVPNGIGAGAVFNVATTAAVTVTLDTPVTLGSLQLGNSRSAGVGYTLSGSGSNTLTLNNSGNGATITVTGGAHAIDAPVILADNLIITSRRHEVPGHSPSGPTSSISRLRRGYSLTMSGTGGTLVLSGSDNYSGGTFVEAGTLIATNSEALPDGSSLIVGSGVALRSRPMLRFNPPRRRPVNALRPCLSRERSHCWRPFWVRCRFTAACSARRGCQRTVYICLNPMNDNRKAHRLATESRSENPRQRRGECRPFAPRKARLRGAKGDNGGFLDRL